MSFKPLWAVAALVFASIPAGAATGYVRAGKLVDPEQGRVPSNQPIQIVDGRVASVEPFTAAPDWIKGDATADASALEHVEDVIKGGALVD